MGKSSDMRGNRSRNADGRLRTVRSDKHCRRFANNTTNQLFQDVVILISVLFGSRQARARQN